MIDATYRQIVARATTLQAVSAALKRRDASARNNPEAQSNRSQPSGGTCYPIRSEA